MKKVLYSLMLNDEVVREIDAAAHRMGTNRSNLINQILAEYVDYITPERRINDILSALDRLMAPSRELVPYFAPNSRSIQLKSSLDVRYRPTVRYEVNLLRTEGDEIGELTVQFRTTSQLLLDAMNDFFRLWQAIELAHPFAPGVRSALYEGRFVRTLTAPEEDCTAEELAQYLSDYISLFDRLLKDRLALRCTELDAELAYIAAMRAQRLHF